MKNKKGQLQPVIQPSVAQQPVAQMSKKSMNTGSLVGIVAIVILLVIAIGAIFYLVSDEKDVVTNSAPPALPEGVNNQVQIQGDEGVLDEVEDLGDSVVLVVKSEGLIDSPPALPY